MANVQLMNGPLDGSELDVLLSEVAIVVPQTVWYPAYHELHGQPPVKRLHEYVRVDETHFKYRKTK